jgi:hypothetical protein
MPVARALHSYCAGLSHIARYLRLPTSRHFHPYCEMMGNSTHHVLAYLLSPYGLSHPIKSPFFPALRKAKAL